MPNEITDGNPQRRITPIFFVLDTSGSMIADDQGGSPISALNEGIQSAWRNLREESQKNPDFEIRAAALTFNTTAQWISNPNALEIIEEEEDPSFGEVEVNPNSGTLYSVALHELGEKLVWGSSLLHKDLLYGLPVIIFITDGMPWDNDPWEEEIERLKRENKWFDRAVRVCLAFNMNADEVNNLRKIASGNRGEEAVIPISDTEMLKTLINFIAVRTSMLVSQGGSTPDGNDIASQVVQQATILQLDD